MSASQPCWGIGLPTRQHLSPDSVGAGVRVKTSLDLGNPVARGANIIIGERDDGGASIRDSCVPRIRQALLWLKNIAKFGRVFGNQRLHHVFGLIGRVVINDKNFIVDVVRFLGKQGLQRPGKKGAPVVAADHYRDVNSH